MTDPVSESEPRGCVVWLTGLSGAGKSTVAGLVERALRTRGSRVTVLDGDIVRQGLSRDLDFSPQGRTENIRRVGEVAALMANAGLVVLCAFISPYRDDRSRARALLPAGRFIEVHVAASLAICEERDTKGLYRRARAGEISQFTGIDAPYEAPLSPEVFLASGTDSASECADQVIELLVLRGLV